MRLVFFFEFPHLTPAVYRECVLFVEGRGRLTGIIQNKMWEKNKRTDMSCIANYNIEQ